MHLDLEKLNNGIRTKNLEDVTNISNKCITGEKNSTTSKRLYKKTIYNTIYKYKPVNGFIISDTDTGVLINVLPGAGSGSLHCSCSFPLP